MTWVPDDLGASRAQAQAMAGPAARASVAKLGAQPGTTTATSRRSTG